MAVQIQSNQNHSNYLRNEALQLITLKSDEKLRGIAAAKKIETNFKQFSHFTSDNTFPEHKMGVSTSTRFQVLKIRIFHVKFHQALSTAARHQIEAM